MPTKPRKTTADIRSLARTHTDSMVKVLASIANSPKAAPAARVSAASELLSRGWGKPKQEVDLGAADSLLEVLRAIDGRTRGLPGN